MKPRIEPGRYKMMLLDGVIADGWLDHYLEGKLLERPDYGFSTEVSDQGFVSRWKQAQEIERVKRKKNNDKTKRGYRL